MAKQTNDYKPKGFRIEATVFAAADGTTPKNLVVAGGDDSVIVQLSVASLSTSTEFIRLSLNDGTTTFFLFDVEVPPNSGKNATKPVDVLATPVIYNASLPIEAGWTLVAAPTSAVSSSGNVTITAIATDY
jgi:hypothetical protein